MLGTVIREGSHNALRSARGKERCGVSLEEVLRPLLNLGVLCSCLVPFNCISAPLGEIIFPLQECVSIKHSPSVLIYL